MRTSRPQRLRTTEPLELAELEHAQELGLRGQRQLADFVEEQRAALRQLEPALACRAWAPVKAPRSWPNSSDSNSVSGSAAQFTLTKGCRARVEFVWIACATELLAGARLAADQRGGVGARHLADLLVDLAHGRARADHVRVLESASPRAPRRNGRPAPSLRDGRRGGPARSTRPPPPARRGGPGSRPPARRNRQKVRPPRDRRWRAAHETRLLISLVTGKSSGSSDVAIGSCFDVRHHDRATRLRDATEHSLP